MSADEIAIDKQLTAQDDLALERETIRADDHHRREWQKHHHQH